MLGLSGWRWFTVGPWWALVPFWIGLVGVARYLVAFVRASRAKAATP
jgi:hypothetical protein